MKNCHARSRGSEWKKSFRLRCKLHVMVLSMFLSIVSIEEKDAVHMSSLFHTPPLVSLHFILIVNVLSSSVFCRIATTWGLNQRKLTRRNGLRFSCDSSRAASCLGSSISCTTSACPASAACIYSSACCSGSSDSEGRWSMARHRARSHS